MKDVVDADGARGLMRAARRATSGILPAPEARCWAALSRNRGSQVSVL